MSRPIPKLVVVKSSTRLTPNMQRVVLTGESLRGFPDGQNGAHIKLILPNEDNHLNMMGGPRPKVRTYTIRNFNASTNELTIDFALHFPAGPATDWAIKCQPDDAVGVAGPGPKKLDTNNGGWYLFAADICAMPAAIAAIEELPDDVEGVALLEITTEEDKQVFDHPENLEIRWLIHPEPHKRSSQQIDAIKALKIPDSPSIFVAGELGTVRKIKEYLLDNLQISTEKVYISSYWKMGINEDGHKQVKAAMN